MAERPKPCGEHHPLPCGVDGECGYLEREKELRELVESWRDKDYPTNDKGAIKEAERDKCAADLEHVLEDHNE